MRIVVVEKGNVKFRVVVSLKGGWRLESVLGEVGFRINSFFFSNKIFLCRKNLLWIFDLRDFGRFIRFLFFEFRNRRSVCSFFVFLLSIIFRFILFFLGFGKV